MSEANETVAVETAPAAAPKKVPAPKKKKAAAPAKPEPKAKKAAATDVKFDDAGRRLTLRNPQVVLLKALKACKNHECTRAALAEKCPGVGLSEHLGTLEGTKNKYTVSLTEQKMVKQELTETADGKSVVSVTLTKKGLDALAKVG